MGTLYIDTGGSITNSGCTDQNAANLTGAAATVSGAVVTLDGSPDLSGLITSGATQSSIYLAQATNTGQKIFWITAFDNTAKTVTVTPSPTGVASSGWAIGGRFHLGATGSSVAANIQRVTRAGDTIIINNSPAQQSTSILLFFNSGDSTNGFITIKGKQDVRPLLKTTGNANVLSLTSFMWLENVEIQNGFAGTAAALSIGGGRVGCVVYNVKVSMAGGHGMDIGGSTATRIVNCEIAGTGVGTPGAAISQSSNQLLASGNYIHNCTGSGIILAGTTLAALIVNNIISTCSDRGIYLSGAPTSSAEAAMIVNNTIYGCGNSGLEVTDADTAVTLFNNIFSSNGDAAGEANIEWVAGTGEVCSIHGYNTIYSPSAVAPINFTLNAQIPGTEFSSDPMFVNPSQGDFRLGIGSPALNTGFPGTFLGALTISSPSQGAVAPSAT